MITTKNQTAQYTNAATRDAISLIRKGESAWLYSETDVNVIKKIFGADKVQIIKLDKEQALKKFGYDDVLYLVSYTDDVLEVMAYAVYKLYILRDMELEISRKDQQYIKHSLTKTEVERKFFELYDKYTSEY